MKRAPSKLMARFGTEGRPDPRTAVVIDVSGEDDATFAARRGMTVEQLHERRTKKAAERAARKAGR